MEAGLKNVVNAEVAVITDIELEHTEFLDASGKAITRDGRYSQGKRREVLGVREPVRQTAFVALAHFGNRFRQPDEFCIVTSRSRP